jgi:DNA repair exonuclease SbcCD nuclease subunit
MRVAILADTHAGVRNNSLVFQEHQIRFQEEVFLPYCVENNIKHMIHLGDVFDRRRDLNPLVYREWDKRVFYPWSVQFAGVNVIVGNHDTYWKNTNAVNTPNLFLSPYDNFFIHESPGEHDLFGVSTLILPWVCESNEELTRSLLSASTADLALGHLEIIGCPMFRGIENVDRGFSQDDFSQFKMVLSGHFHLKSYQKNIHYLGSPVATTWAEAFDRRGFHVLDTETLELEFIENPYSPFVVIRYEDSVPDDLLVLPDLKDRFVRIEVKRKSSEAAFLSFVEAIEKAGAADISVQGGQSIAVSDESFDEHLDLFSLMDAYVDSVEVETPREQLKAALRELYSESLQLHDLVE